MREGVKKPFFLETFPKSVYPLELAMRLRIHAVHADDLHMRIHAHRCTCENIDAHQPHTKAKKTIIPPSIYAVMHVLDLNLAVGWASHQCE